MFLNFLYQFNNFITMNTKTTALQNHFLSSVLPYDSLIRKPVPIPKTKQFYKPEQFIWNNPHRTSGRLYPYYHKANDQYLQKVKPKIEQLQQQDRQRMENDRIQRLNKIRFETRSKFFNKKQERLELQAKSHANSDKYLTERFRRRSQKVIPSPSNNYHTGNSQSLVKNRISTLNVSRTIKSYDEGITSYDNNLNNIRQLMRKQLDENRQSIRRQFRNRKIANEKFRNKTKIDLKQ